MFKHPALNAVAAAAYIVLIVTGMTYFIQAPNEPDGIMAPIAALSLFTLSAAVMGYLFVLQPLQMYLDGKKKEAVTYFTQTIGYFAGITVIILIISMFFRGY